MISLLRHVPTNVSENVTKRSDQLWTEFLVTQKPRWGLFYPKRKTRVKQFYRKGNSIRLTVALLWNVIKCESGTTSARVWSRWIESVTDSFSIPSTKLSLNPLTFVYVWPAHTHTRTKHFDETVYSIDWLTDWLYYHLREN